MLFPRLNILENGDLRSKLNILLNIRKIIPEKNHIAWATGLVVLFLLYFYGYQAINAYRIARDIESTAQALKQAVLDKNWESADEILKAIDSSAAEIEYSINRLYPFTLLPGISQEANAAQDIITASRISIASGIEAVNWIKDIPVINEISFDSFSSLTEAQKRELLKALSESGDLWNRVNNQTILSLQFLEQARQETKIPIITSQIKSIGLKLAQAQELFAQIQPWIAIAPSVLGYPNQKTYLLLLQNNTELRPTGGFIGTYGVLKIRNAEVASFTTDNVYNLDEPAKAYNTKVPPLPMQKYIKQSQWFFRDSNWDPDFPTTAQTAIQFYKDERLPAMQALQAGGPEKHFDGVIALTPTVVEDLMQVLGPVYVEDKEFTSENLIDTLAYHVEKGFKEEGITIYNRKQIIDEVAQQLKTKLFSLSMDQIRALAPIVFESINERQMMFWFEDKNTQRVVRNLNWDGRVILYQGDYLYVVDANLGSLKSDPAIKRTIDYALKVADSGELQATASITYEHTADFDWKTTRYRTYARVYVPQGSRFVKASGNEEEIAIGNEHGKTVFGTFISIEPFATETLSFTYILPKDLKSRILSDGYSLYLQKQAGTIAHAVHVDLTLPFKIDTIAPQGILKKENSNHVIGDFDLSVDREFAIMQK